PVLRGVGSSRAGTINLGGSAAWSLKRGAAFAAVVALHLVLFLAISRARRPQHAAAAADFVSVLLLLPETGVAQALGQMPRKATRLNPRTDTPLARESSSPLPSPASTGGAAVDWSQEARRAATDVTAAPKFRKFGHAPGMAADTPQRRPAHQAGD